MRAAPRSWLVNPRFRRRRRRPSLRALLQKPRGELGTLRGYSAGTMASRCAAQTELLGPHSGGWMWSQRISVLGAIHSALRATTALDWFQRDKVALGLARMLPMSPEPGYWDTKAPTWVDPTVW